MGQIWIRQFTGGLDARRMPETTPGGALIRAIDGHINRGGEFEKRAAFKLAYTLPPGTTGLAATSSGLVAFGSVASPAMPAGVGYYRLVPPNGSLLTKLLSSTRFSGPLYSVGKFSDGKIYHFYDTALVEDWFDGRAHATFTITSGTVTPGVKATGSFQFNYAQQNGPNDTYQFKVGTTDLLASPFTHSPFFNAYDNVASGIVNAINANTAVSGYSATRVNNVITITANADGAAPNGKAITAQITTSIGTNISNVVAMHGGADATQPVLSNITVGGVAIITAPIAWTGNTQTTASAVAAAISSAALGYTAVAKGNDVQITASVIDEAEFGKPVVVTASNMTVTPATGLVMAGGGALTPGEYVTTIGSKIYSVSGPNLHFSAIKGPTKWQPGTDNVGAGFIDMSSEASGSENLKAVAKYQQWVAVFGEQTTQIWYVDPDPALNKQAQVLGNTGTVAGRSVTQFGDADLFYLDESGVRSLRARDASNAAATSDIGVPVDTLLIEKLASMTPQERSDIKAVIEPRDGRYWLIMKDEIYVFSYFPGSKVSAWSVYTASTLVDGVLTEFTIDDVAIFDRRIYVRSGDLVYVYGGIGDVLEYDETEPLVWQPFLDGETPTRQKDLSGIDVACLGEWQVSIGMQPNNLDAEDLIGTVFETTFNGDTLPAGGRSTHFSLRFRGKGDGPRRLGSAVIHYEAEKNED